MIVRKSRTEIEAMRRAGRVVAETLARLGELARPGATTGDLDEAAEEYIRSEGGVPTFKGYRGFPAAICTSPNSMVVHGIPGTYRLEDGDLLSVDVGVTLDGFVADSAFTFAVGEIDSDAAGLAGCRIDGLHCPVARRVCPVVDWPAAKSWYRGGTGNCSRGRPGGRHERLIDAPGEIASRLVHDGSAGDNLTVALPRRHVH